MAFTGIPMAAVDFYEGLELDNSREYWAAHEAEYLANVRGPMEALVEELADEFGPAKVYRPYRDVRFSADKSPYKTHQGAFVRVAEATGWYAQVSADGFRVGGGTYRMDAAALAAFRKAVAHDRTGPGLERIVDELRRAGWELGGNTLRTAPRGWSRDHPRIELLRHRSLTALRWIEDADVVTSPRLVDEVRTCWRELRPLVEWLGRAQSRDTPGVGCSAT
jgi:uncharacterized protein (TIGR02453 family)